MDAARSPIAPFAASSLPGGEGREAAVVDVIRARVPAVLLVGEPSDAAPLSTRYARWDQMSSLMDAPWAKLLAGSAQRRSTSSASMSDSS